LNECNNCLYKLIKEQASECFCLIKKEMITSNYWEVTAKDCKDFSRDHHILNNDDRISMAHELIQEKAENRRLNKNIVAGLLGTVAGGIISNLDRFINLTKSLIDKIK